MATVQASVHRVLQAYRKSVADKDAAALMRLYDPNVRVFDAWGVWSYEGAANWQVAVTGWLSSLGDERATVEYDDVQITGQGGFALMTCIVTYAGFSAQGEPLRSMQNRLTWVLAPLGDETLIVHEHTSAPIGFEDTKAILQRKPAA